MELHNIKHLYHQSANRSTNWLKTTWLRVTGQQRRNLELELIKTNQKLLTEIVERQRTEAALSLSEQRYEIAVEASNVGVWDWNITTGEVYMAPNLKAMLGYEEEDIPNTEAGIGTFTHPEDYQFMNEQMYAYCTGAAPNYEVKFRALKKDGSSRWVMSRGSIISRDANGAPIRIAGSIADITKLQQAEEDITRALAKEKELNELKTRFISTTSHEFRTPLSVILSSAELLQYYGHKWTPEKKQELFDCIQTSVSYMTQLLEDILLFGKAEGHALQPHPEKIELGNFCQQLVEDFQLTQPTNHPIAFNNSCSKTEVYLDKNLLRQILINLLSNAFKYSPDSEKIYFEVECQPHQTKFQVRDEGIGISERDQTQIFDPFYRGSNVGTIPGTGIGLALVKKLVELQGGEIILNSEIKKGTSVFVTIPLTTPDLSLLDPEHNQS